MEILSSVDKEYLVLNFDTHSPGGAVDSPYPFMSRANTLNPAAATAGI